MKGRQSHIALVENDPAIREICGTILTGEGHRVTTLERGTEALDFLTSHSCDLLLIDLRLADMGGLDVLRNLQEKRFRTPVIVMTGYGSIDTAVEAMRFGARDFLVKPINPDRLRNAVRNELANNPGGTMPIELAGAVEEPAPPHAPIRTFGGFIGISQVMQSVYEQIEAAARSNAAVFITGESGTGKEICAEAIHKHSARADRPFIPINCAAIPRDLMESELFGHVRGAFTGAIADRDGAVRMASGGTLFLDEIAEMNPDMQTKLLRFLQDFTFRKIGGNKVEKTDLRIICATNRNPAEEIAAARFREDLFYRLHVLPICMPPLRLRGEDIVDIAQTLLLSYSTEEGKSFARFSEEAEEMLRHYAWPGNIRQLQNAVRHIVVMNDASVATVGMLPPGLLQGHVPANSADPHTAAPSLSPILPLAEVERAAIEHALQYCHGNVPKAAAALGVSPSTVYRKKAGWGEPGNNSGHA